MAVKILKGSLKWIRALRTDQAGESTFLEFLMSSWQAGVIRYEVDFEARRVTYFGASGESYVEAYPAVAMATPEAPNTKEK